MCVMVHKSMEQKSLWHIQGQFQYNFKIWGDNWLGNWSKRQSNLWTISIPSPSPAGRLFWNQNYHRMQLACNSWVCLSRKGSTAHTQTLTHRSGVWAEQALLSALWSWVISGGDCSHWGREGTGNVSFTSLSATWSQQNLNDRDGNHMQL